MHIGPPDTASTSTASSSLPSSSFLHPSIHLAPVSLSASLLQSAAFSCPSSSSIAATRPPPLPLPPSLRSLSPLVASTESRHSPCEQTAAARADTLQSTPPLSKTQAQNLAGHLCCCCRRPYFRLCVPKLTRPDPPRLTLTERLRAGATSNIIIGGWRCVVKTEEWP